MRTKFTRLDWYYTNGEENLFELDETELALFRLMVQESLK